MGGRYALTGPIPEGSSFFCPRCGALYAVTYSRRWKSVDIGDDDNAAKCVVCEQATWSSTDVPTYKLVHRPEDA
jgi:transcription elongation factor Elf1